VQKNQFSKKKYEKTDLGFGFPTLDYVWSNFIKNHFFTKKTYPLCKKKIFKKKYEKTDLGFGFLDLKNIGLKSIPNKFY
jgi:hypothetical protein